MTFGESLRVSAAIATRLMDSRAVTEGSCQPGLLHLEIEMFVPVLPRLFSSCRSSPPIRAQSLGSRRWKLTA